MRQGGRAAIFVLINALARRKKCLVAGVLSCFFMTAIVYNDLMPKEYEGVEPIRVAKKLLEVLPLSPEGNSTNGLLSRSEFARLRKNCRIIKSFPCDKIFKGDRDVSERAKYWFPPDYMVVDPGVFYARNHHQPCDAMLRKLNFITAPLSREEADNPLAFAMLIHSNFNSFVRVLRRLYQPQNAFCIHVDEKATEEYREAVKLLVKCLPNAKMAPKILNIRWGSPNILIGAVNCLRILNDMRDSKWIYAQIFSEIDIPLRTNREMVEIFKIFDGANDVEMIQDTTIEWFQWSTYVSEFQDNSIHLRFTNITKPPLPGVAVLHKGSFAATMSRAFVNFMMTDPIALDIFNWTLDTFVADEKLWSTLNHNLHLEAPGRYPGACLSKTHPKPFISRYQTWEMSGRQTHCFGHYTRWSCAYGVGDLPILVKLPHLVAHKFEADIQPAAAMCLDEWLCKRQFGLTSEPKLNRTFYEDLPAVRYHKMADKSKFVCPGPSVL